MHAASDKEAKRSPLAIAAASLLTPAGTIDVVVNGRLVGIAVIVIGGAWLSLALGLRSSKLAPPHPQLAVSIGVLAAGAFAIGGAVALVGGKDPAEGFSRELAVGLLGIGG